MPSCGNPTYHLPNPREGFPVDTLDHRAEVLMAASGVVFIGFVLLHMYGNLKAFAGHDAYNEYAEHLRTFGEPMLPYARPALGASAWC